MDSQKPEINELISGLLDGHLSIEESKKLAEESSKNPQIERDTETLGSLRSSLLRGRPTGKLGDHFAVRVMEAARTRAALLGEDAPEWIETSNARIVPKPFDPSELKTRWWVPALSVVATCVLAFLFTQLSLLYNQSLDREQQNQIADFQKKQIEQDLLSVFEKPTDKEPTVAAPGEAPTSSIVDTMLAESKKRTDSSENASEPSLVADAQASSLLGETRTESPAREMSAGNALAASPTENVTSGTNSLVDLAQPTENRGASGADMAAESSVVASNAKDVAAKDVTAQNPLLRATGKMMAVYEVTVDQVALNDDVLGLYLQKHGLGAVEDLVLDQDKLSSVLKSGIVGPADSQGESQVLVLKGTARMLSEFYDDLVSSYEDFPALRMNAVMDDSVGMLEKQMTTMQVSDERGAVGRLGSSGPSGLVSSFATGSSKFFEVPMEQRRLEKRREPGRDLNPVSYVILIVRTAK
ncbi:MAG: hypothetical protein MUC43_01735 [Pirellula sp.]|jgi:hypothetical protein|nr:hypothetical protein [Pirellula sp.]